MPFDIPEFNINKTVVEKNISQFENKKSIEKQEQYLNDIQNKELIELGYKEKYPKGVKTTFLSKNLFVVKNNNSNTPIKFIDNENNLLLSIIARKEQISIKNHKNGNPGKAMIKAGFVFGDNLELRKIVGYENGSLIIKGKVDTYSKEYYHAWKKILRASGDIYVNTLLKGSNKTKFHHDNFGALLETGALTKEIIEKFNKKGILTEEDYQFGLDYLKKQEQENNKNNYINDAIDNINGRLKGIKLEMPNTESSIKLALENNKISKDEALRMFNDLPDEMKDLSNKKV